MLASGTFQRQPPSKTSANHYQQMEARHADGVTEKRYFLLSSSFDTQNVPLFELVKIGRTWTIWASLLDVKYLSNFSAVFSHIYLVSKPSALVWTRVWFTSSTSSSYWLWVVRDQIANPWNIPRFLRDFLSGLWNTLISTARFIFPFARLP